MTRYTTNGGGAPRRGAGTAPRADARGDLRALVAPADLPRVRRPPEGSLRARLMEAYSAPPRPPGPAAGPRGEGA